MFRTRRNSTPGNILYHGTSSNFSQLSPQPNSRESDSVEWRGEAIFATPDYRIALHYTANKANEHSVVSAGIDLRTPQEDVSETIQYIIIGGESLEAALDELYGSPSDPESCIGYIYHLNGSFFNREVGLGAREKITRKLDTVLWREKVNRRVLIDHYIKTRSIELIWIANTVELEKSKLPSA